MRRALAARYWRLEDVVAAGHADPLDVSDEEATDRLAALLQTRSDVR